MACTGHRNTTGVRSYKRASKQLIEETSDVLNGKKGRLMSSWLQWMQIIFVLKSLLQQLASMPQIASVAQSEQTMPQLGLFNISSSSVTFNVNNNFCKMIC